MVWEKTKREIMETNEIIQGDALEQLKLLPDESISCVMTSPPYWALRDYGTAKWEGGNNPECKHLVGRLTRTITDKSKIQQGNIGGYGDESIKIGGCCPHCGAKRVDKQLGLETTFQEYITKLCDIFDEVKRVLRKDGTCWVNLGDSYMGNSSYSNEGRQGFAGKDGNTKEWVRPIGSGTCLICNKEIPPNKQFCSKECLNKKGNEFRTQNRLLPDKTLCNIPARFSIEMQNRGWILRNVIIWHKPNCMPSSVKDRFTIDFEYLFFFVKNKKYFFETQYELQKEVSIQRAKYQAFNRSKKMNGTHAGMTIESFNKNLKKVSQTENPVRNKRAVWRITTKPFKESHFAVYPEELCWTPIKAGCPEFVCNKCGKAREKIIESENNERTRKIGEGQDTEIGTKGRARSLKIKELGYSDCKCNAGFSGGIILDPFFGAGTTGLVALKQNKQFIGIELKKEYIEIAKRRLKPYLEQEKLQ
jgi:DNA modification methylase